MARGPPPSQFEFDQAIVAPLQTPIRLAESMEAAMAFTVIWYGEHGIVAKTPFADEKTAKTHAIATFPALVQNDGIVSVEVRKDDGTVVFSHAGNK